MNIPELTMQNRISFLKYKLNDKRPDSTSVHSFPVPGLFQSGAQWLFRNEPVLHVNPHSFFILPPEIIFRVAIKIWGVFLTLSGRFVSSIISP
jgi:hypothetical protein